MQQWRQPLLAISDEELLLDNWNFMLLADSILGDVYTVLWTGGWDHQLIKLIGRWDAHNLNNYYFNNEQ